MTRRRHPRREVELTADARRDLRELAARFGRRIESDYIRAVSAIQRGARPPGDHPLMGNLRGWRAFAIGPQTPPEQPRVVYYLTTHRIRIMAAGEHEAAYIRATLRRRG